MEEQLIQCTKCESEDANITNVYNTIPMGLDYPPKSCKYKQGAVVIELTCKNCEHKQFIVIGQHKGQVFLSKVEEGEV